MKRPMFKLAVFGIVCEMLFAWYAMGDSLWDMFDLRLEPSFTLSMYVITAAGMATCIWVGNMLDKKKLHPSLLGFVFASLIIFLSGNLLGIAISFLYQGVLLDDSPLSHAFHDWFFKPVYWLGLFGIPASVLVGIFFYVIGRLRLKKSVSEASSHP